MTIIKVVQPQQSGIFYQLHSLYETFKQANDTEKVIFDLRHITKLYPLIITAISSYITENKSDFLLPANTKITNYLESIHFPYGIDSSKRINHKGNNFIPLSYIRERAGASERDKILFSFLNLIYGLIGQIEGIKNAFFYPLAELVENIFEHSKKDYGCMFGQINEEEKYVEICIADNGRGIRGSYKEEINLDISDEEALGYCLIGQSTKGYERGYGVRTSKRVICEGFKGDFMLLSGQAVYAASGKEDFSPPLPGFNWKGVIISYRIPYSERIVNIHQYLE